MEYIYINFSKISLRYANQAFLLHLWPSSCKTLAVVWVCLQSLWMSWHPGTPLCEQALLAPTRWCLSPVLQAASLAALCIDVVLQMQVCWWLRGASHMQLQGQWVEQSQHLDHLNIKIIGKDFQQKPALTNSFNMLAKNCLEDQETILKFFRPPEAYKSPVGTQDVYKSIDYIKFTELQATLFQRSDSTRSDVWCPWPILQFLFLILELPIAVKKTTSAIVTLSSHTDTYFLIITKMLL